MSDSIYDEGENKTYQQITRVEVCSRKILLGRVDNIEYT